MNNDEKIDRIAKDIAGSMITAMAKVTTYKQINIYLNGNDHRPPHLVAMCPNNEEEKADFCINNGTDKKYPDGSLLTITKHFPKDKLKDAKEWFAPDNREERINKVMNYILDRGEPTWFKVEEIFTDTELSEYNRRKNERKKQGEKEASTRIALKKPDLTKPWSLDNNYDEVTNIVQIVANDDYTLSVWFQDGSKKTYDVHDKIFDKSNRDYRWFSRLQDLNEFKKVRNVRWAVIWDDDTDLSSYELYVNGK